MFGVLQGNTNPLFKLLEEILNHLLKALRGDINSCFKGS